jgi:transcription elongation factor Elf1
MPLPMPSSAPMLPLFCPRCDHDNASLHVNSYTVVTVQCPVCGHVWALEISLLSESVRKQISPRRVA